MTGQEPSPPQRDPLGDIEAAESSTVAILHAERPTPSPTFRGDLRRLVTAEQTKPLLNVRASIQAQIVGLLGAGAALLLIAAAGIVGAGPFSA